ncbi:MAG TPA: DUF4105 domain-containing protein, partial [Myxococcota bacterium]|nr:DUF4105 domain-containing protein [Myxococcota bacterium]
ATALLAVPIFGFCFWAAAALWIDGPESRGLAGVLVAAFALGCFLVLVYVRSFARSLAGLALLALAVTAWWLRIPASNARDWQPDVGRLAHAQIDADRVTIENVRNFAWRTETDYDPSWETRTYDLQKLRGVDLFISFWGPTLYGHTIMSWEFEDSPPLAISIETRKELGESYSALLGFFRQYELYYVVSDERDVIGVRDRLRGERTYLYRLAAPVDRARELLLDYLAEVNSLAAKPDWYNALTQNCTTTIRTRVMHAGGHVPLSWKLLANGYLDELMYERGSLGKSVPLADLRERCDVTERAKAAGIDPDFSARIREGLPDYPR